MHSFNRGRRAARALVAAVMLVSGAALATATPSTALAAIDRPGPVPPCPTPVIVPPVPPAPVPAMPGDTGSGAGTITTTSNTPGAGCGPESFSVSTLGTGQVQVINDPVPGVGSVVTYDGIVNIDITGSSTEQNASTAVGSASVFVHGENPDPIPDPGPLLNLAAVPTADVLVPSGIECPLTGSYVRQAGTLTVTASGTCEVTLMDYTTDGRVFTYVVNGHYATFEVIGTHAPAGDAQVPVTPTPFTDTWVETDFHS